MRDHIIRIGPVQISIAFPSTDGRSFSKYYYTKKMPNGEVIKREWIVYSEKLDSAHCFCCLLFQENITEKGFSSTNGFNDWKHLSERVNEHEMTAYHLNNYTKWKSTAKLFSNDKTIEYQLNKQMQAEKERLREVFKRIIAFVLYFARQNIAFTGSSSKLHDDTGHNGNFLQLVQTVATFDHVLKEHLEKSKHVHYLSPKTQNELIEIIGAKVKKQILDWIKKSKYYSVILDTTPDVSRFEQMTMILRYVLLNENTRLYEIKESFIEFINVFVKTGLGLAQVLKDELQTLDLDLNDLRGQGYDNGSSFKGKNIGVQKKITEEYPRAFFVPCSSHSLNLVVNDAAGSSGCTVGFFTFVQHIYNFLSGSTNRWDILREQLGQNSGLTPKPICATRWSSRIDAMKPLRHNPIKIIAALNEIHDSDKFDTNARHEAGCISDKIDYTFICCVCVWYDILFQINIASKSLQSIKSNVQTAMLSLQSVMTFLDDYAINGFEKVIREAGEIADRIGIEKVHTNQEKRPSTQRYLASDEQFKDDFLLFIIEVATNSVTERFETLKKHDDLFSFLYKFENYDENRINGNLLKSCQSLENALSHNGVSDIDSNDLFCEFPVVSTLVRSNNLTMALDILNAIQKINIENLVPNFVIALRIFLTTPVTVAQGERSFSKLKLIKNYLRNSMSQNRLNGLAIISIENEVANTINYEDVIETFAETKARKKTLI